ncbi:GIY-YIG nuclease family protein [Shewanella sp. VB17]|uniref:GIY-YIG nuclease family protein n=1 Tax=Shewanella sp. VB17 TaxID=2739432 RepID=UPI0015669E46|nr:GIY-YIG nuclease family protein [Shewanella sp. VB17]NRD72178.1 GIY-YIG nuclease family protein [Shewanella sp. VB17]
MNTKELKKKYKDMLEPMGVYRILNQEEHLYLMGSSKNIRATLNRHRTELKFGTHRNKALQADWNRLGNEAFSFEVVELLPPPKNTSNYDPLEDLNELLELILERGEYNPEKRYQGK